jgi:pimeloyl-ACP methyl ester carboxylesterase
MTGGSCGRRSPGPEHRWGAQLALAYDFLAAGLPDVVRVTLPGVGHLPWLEVPSASPAPLRGFLEAGR